MTRLAGLFIVGLFMVVALAAAHHEYLQGFVFKVPTGDQGNRDKVFEMPGK
jgi:hypothetical protein